MATLSLKGKPAAPAAAPAAAPNFDAQHIKVRCIVDSKPWTHDGPLENGEEVEIPAELAQLMLAKKQVELV